MNPKHPAALPMMFESAKRSNIALLVGSMRRLVFMW
jgi:hypothetical protein